MGIEFKLWYPVMEGSDICIKNISIRNKTSL